MHRLIQMTALILPLMSAPALADDPIAPACRAAYAQGFKAGVEGVNAQLGTWRDQVQTQVQGQLDAQLAQLARQNEAALAQRLQQAHEEALTTSVTQKMPTLPGAADATPRSDAPRADEASQPAPRTRDTGLSEQISHDAAKAGSAGAAPESSRAIPAQSDLPEGTTITIRDPQNLPPELYAGLMSYLTN